MKGWSRITACAGFTFCVATSMFAQDNEVLANRAGSASPIPNGGKETWVLQAEDFVPMTKSERLAHYVYSLAGPQAFLYSAAQAGLNQLRNQPEEWRQTKTLEEAVDNSPPGQDTTLHDASLRRR